jgi:hypothetical protein
MRGTIGVHFQTAMVGPHTAPLQLPSQRYPTNQASIRRPLPRGICSPHLFVRQNPPVAASAHNNSSSGGEGGSWFQNVLSHPTLHKVPQVR